MPLPILFVSYNVVLYFFAVMAIFVAFQRAYQDDSNRPREWWLSVVSGSAFASRRRWGGESITPFMDAD